MRPTDYDYGSDHPSLHGGLKHHEPLYTDDLHNEDVAHEHSDVNIRTLLAFAVGLAAVVAVTFALMRGLFVAFENMAAKNDPVLSPHALPPDQLPPEPRLLINEPKELAKLRERDHDELTKYRWVDQQAGVAALPIDQAKKLLLERGLPVRADSPADPWIGTRWMGPARGESSSGRAIPMKPGASQEPAPAPTPAPTDPHKGGHE